MNNLTWHNTSVTNTDHENLNKHKGACLWFTGLSGSGKSTVANLVEQELHSMGIHTYLLDGDNIRLGLNSDLDFSEKSREENIRRIGEVAKLFVDAGIIVITAFISPYKKDRQVVREKFFAGKFVEVFVDCPIEICEQRDPKGLYKKARAGEIPNFTGISSPYEKPLNPEITLLNRNDDDLKNGVEKVIQSLKDKGILP